MADALASGASVLRDVGVQVPLRPQIEIEASHRLRVTRLDFFNPVNCLSDTARARVVFGVAHGSFLRMRLAYIALVSVALLSAACSTAVDGSAVKESGAAPGPTVDISKLDVGPYPTQPSQPLGVTGDPLRGVLVEAQRMANNVVGPWEVDSTLTGWFGFSATVLQNADALAQIGPEPFAAAASQHGFINGFASARTAEGQKILLNAVLRFADPGAAALPPQTSATSRPRQARACSAPRSPVIPTRRRRATPRPRAPRGKRWSAVRAFTAHGQYVFMQLAQAVDGMDPAVGLVAKTIDLQGPAIDKFRATDPVRVRRHLARPDRTVGADAAGSGQRSDDHPEHHLRTTRRVALPERSGAVGHAVLRDRDGFGGDGENERLPDQGLRERGANRGWVLRRVAADVAAGQAGQQPAGQPLPSIGGSRASTVWAPRTATRSKPPRRTCWMPSSRWLRSTRCW